MGTLFDSSYIKRTVRNPHAKPEQDMCIQGKTYTQRPFIGNIGKASDRHAVIVTGTKNMAGYQEIVMTNSNGEFKFDQLDFLKIQVSVFLFVNPKEK